MTNKKETYLRRRSMDILGNPDLDQDIPDLSLDMVMTSFAQLSSTDKDGDTPPMVTDSMSNHYAQRLIAGHFVVFRDPMDNFTYYVKAHGNDLVAVFHTLGPWYERWTALGSTESILVTLGVNRPHFTEKEIIDRIFDWPSESLEVDVPKAVISPSLHAHWRWHIPTAPAAVSPAVAKEAIVERNMAKPELQTTSDSDPRSGGNATVEMTTEGSAPPVIVVPQTAMGEAFAGAMNQTRGGDRRTGDRRDHQR